MILSHKSNTCKKELARHAIANRKDEVVRNQFRRISRKTIHMQHINRFQLKNAVYYDKENVMKHTKIYK